MLKKQIIKQVKNNLTLNNSLELQENISIDAKGKGRKFTSKFIEAGVAYYEEFGDVLITKETLDKFINTIIGCPVIIKHKNIDDSNADKERVGVISEVWFNEHDGWFYCDGIIWDKQAIDLVKNQGWSVSCTYDFESDFENKIHNGKKIDMEFINGKFLHLALVDNPRYERANIVMNSKDVREDNEKEQTMNVLNELTEFVKNIINNSGKEKEMSKEEKIKDLLKDKVDEETIQNVLNALEEEKEEKREEKEEKFEEEKELAENKCKNEDDEKDKKLSDEKEEEKQEVKNSMEMVNRVINNSFEVENSLYMSQSKRIELGNNY